MVSTKRPSVKGTNLKMEQDLYDKLHQLYYRPDFAGSLGGIQRLLREARKEIPTLKQKQVEEFLTTQDPYTLYKLSRRKFRRSRIFVRRVAQLYQAGNSSASGQFMHLSSAAC